MSFAEGLVDLSLFAWAPTNDRFSITPDAPGPYGSYSESLSNEIQEQYAPRRLPDEIPRRHEGLRREEVMKPLPPLPRSRICQQAASRCDDGSQCILKRIKRTGTSDSGNPPSALLQRRNLTTPQLTLSVPQPSQGPRPEASAMVWMPEEQMWLVLSESEPINEYYAPRTAYPAPSSYPTPPTYTPGAFVRSEPSTRVHSQWHVTPPPTPLQSQLQSLLQPRDEERLSPLFQEAMNSVPLTDPFDLPPPPSYEGTVRQNPPITRPRTSVGESFVSSLSPTDSQGYVQRAQTTGSRRPRGSTETSSQGSLSTPESPVSGHARSQTNTGASRNFFTPANLQNLNGSSRSWHGLAKKIARPKSAT